MSDEEHPPVPCKNFINDGCQIWCLDGDLDCCVLCCKRHFCEKNGSICPKAREILRMKKFKDKVYSWEIVPEGEKNL